MVRSKVINETKSTITLKEGTVGAYTVLMKINKGESYTVNAEEDATYREFVCVVTDPTSHLNTLTFTSEDCIENEEFRIVTEANSALGIKRTPRKTSPIDGLSDDNIVKAIKRAPSKIANFFKLKKSPQPSGLSLSPPADTGSPSKPRETA